MNAREVFTAARRAYRAARSVPPDSDSAIAARRATTTLLRAITQRWDTCEPAAFYAWADKPHRRHWIARPIVTNTCRAFCRRTNGRDKA